MKKSELKSILLVDDDFESLDMYERLLKSKTKAHISTCRYPGVALNLATKHFFDLILIDVTMNYQGTQFGGLELYKSLMSRYGDSSLIVYSQFITDDLLRQYHYEFNFIEKGIDPDKFIEQVLSRLKSLRKEQSCFVAMPFTNKHDHIFQVIKSCVEDASYQCIRVDQQQFTKSIIDKIFHEINRAKLVIFLATEQNANAFYECGYAVALNKEVITLTDTYHNLPFDIRDRNAIEYDNDYSKLQIELAKKLAAITQLTSQ